MAGRSVGTGGPGKPVDDGLDPEDAPVRPARPDGFRSTLQPDDMAPDDAPTRTSPRSFAPSPMVVAVTPEIADPGSNVRSSHPRSLPSAAPRPEPNFQRAGPVAEESLEIVPPRWHPTAYRAAGVQAVDAPVAEDMFDEGGYEDFEDLAPPTDEGPAQVMEDVGQPYTTPFTVPEPPPIPGIVDRFTPPPAQRTEIGSRRKKPDFLGEEAPKAKDFRPTPAPGRGDRPRAAPPVPRQRPTMPEEPPPSSGRGTVLAVVGGLLGLIGLGSLAASVVVFYLATARPGADEEDEGPAPIPTGDLTVRDPDATKTDLPPVQPMPNDAPQPEDFEADAPKPPTPGPAPAPAPAAASKGTLKIRSNRRVLVYLDDKVVGYTPQTITVDPGKYSILAMMPGQPNTKQAREAKVTGPGATVNVDFSF